MSQNSMLDPFAIWKSMYENTDSNLSETINETLHKESFAEWLGQLQGGFLQYQQLIQNTTDAYLKQINMPTREEISSIASLIINVEEKIESLDEKFDDELAANSVSSEISKLKTNVNKLEKKMDLILQALSTVETSTQTPASSAKQNNKS